MNGLQAMCDDSQEDESLTAAYIAWHHIFFQIILITSIAANGRNDLFSESSFSRYLVSRINSWPPQRKR